MKKYDVTFTMDGYYTCTVEANSEEEAEKLAKEELYDVDCGELQDVNGRICYIDMLK